jgi:hypothetical protein
MEVILKEICLLGQVTGAAAGVVGGGLNSYVKDTRRPLSRAYEKMEAAGVDKPVPQAPSHLARTGGSRKGFADVPGGTLKDYVDYMTPSQEQQVVNSARGPGMAQRAWNEMTGQSASAAKPQPNPNAGTSMTPAPATPPPNSQSPSFFQRLRNVWQGTPPVGENEHIPFTNESIRNTAGYGRDTMTHLKAIKNRAIAGGLGGAAVGAGFDQAVQNGWIPQRYLHDYATDYATPQQ